MAPETFRRACVLGGESYEQSLQLANVPTGLRMSRDAVPVPSRMLRRALPAVSALNERICSALLALAGLLLFAMTMIVMLQVVSRYGFNSSLIWTESVSKTMMVWSAFLVAPWAYRLGANVSIDMLAEQLPLRVRRGLVVGLDALVIWILVVFAIESIGLVLRGMQIRDASLPITVGWFYTVLPVSFAILLLVGCERLMRGALNLMHPDEDFTLSPPVAAVEGE